MPAIGPSFKISGIEPKEVRDSDLADRIAFWTAVSVFVIEAKEEELIRGEDRYGNPMVELAEITRKHRRSEMGTADPDAPPLQPAHGLSRTRSLFTAEPNVGARGVICWWTYDDISGDSWGEILAYHRAGSDRLPVRDVIGLSPASVAGVKSRAWDWWENYVPGSTPAPPLLLGPKSGIDIGGHHYDLQSGTAADIEKAIADGMFTFHDVIIPTPGPTFGFTAPTVKPPVLTMPMAPAPVMTEAAVVLGEGWDAAASADLIALLGPEATPELVATLAGAPPGTTATVTPGAAGSFVVDVVADGVHIKRAISSVDGKLIVQNVIFELSPDMQGQGIGTEVLAMQIEAAEANGVSKITLAAAGSADDEMVGYKVWPKFGFDGPLPPKILDILPPEFAGAKLLSDLYATPEGQAWWEANGSTIGLSFDPTPGSYSMLVWQAYLDGK